MGILDWPSNILAALMGDSREDEERLEAIRQSHLRAVNTLTLTGCRSEPAPTWQHTVRIGPVETHKHRMARLIARREGSGR